MSAENILTELVNSRQQDFELIGAEIDKIKNKYSDILIQDQGNESVRVPLSQILRDNTGLKIISEIKPASPSKGVIVSNLNKQQDLIMGITLPNLDKIIREMIIGGARAISVLTEPRKFFGSYGNLFFTHRAIPLSIPLLLKDFITEECQLELGALCGASNALLIAALGDPIRKLRNYQKFGLEPLIEVHDSEDLELIAELAHSDENFIIGVNNRNLRDFSIDLHRTIELVPEICEKFGEDQPIISESGLESRNDLLHMEQYNVKGVLIGTAIMQGNIRHNLQSLLGLQMPFIKICGIKDASILKELASYIQHQINAIGIVVNVPQSKRNMTIEQAKLVFEQLPSFIFRTVVSKNLSMEEVLNLNEELQPDLIQNHLDDPLKCLNELPNTLLRKLIIPIKIENYDNFEDIVSFIDQFPSNIFAILLDSSEGNGKRFNLSFNRQILNKYPKRRFILAGGIGTENVQLILRQVRPFGLDVSSSLENNGEKDIGLMNDFFRTLISSEGK